MGGLLAASASRALCAPAAPLTSLAGIRLSQARSLTLTFGKRLTFCPTSPAATAFTSFEGHGDPAPRAGWGLPGWPSRQQGAVLGAKTTLYSFVPQLPSTVPDTRLHSVNI